MMISTRTNKRKRDSMAGTIDAEALIQNIYADRLISTCQEPRLTI
jgi:hypothetical protein